MKLALHACCGPCLLEPLDALSAETAQLVVVYANPNIHPLPEYERRRDTLKDFAGEAGVDVVELPYEPGLWLEQVGPLASRRQERCRACYRLRATMVATWAAAAGFDALATTLTVSPYQDAEAIAEEGEAVAVAHGLRYLNWDFRDRYGRSVERSRALGMYRQNYCGCVMSEIEARQEREARSAARKGAPKR